MRKIFANLKSVVALAVVAAMTLSVSCMYDDTALTKRVDKVEKDLAALTERVNALDNASLEDLLAGNAVITGYAKDEAGNVTLTLSNGETVTVLAGSDALQYRVVDGVLEISADGNAWVAVTTPAECVVKSAVVNEDGSVTIVLADGTEFTVGVAELVEFEATRSQVYVKAGETKAIPFAINDAVEDINVMNQPLGWKASVESTRAVGGMDFVLNVTAPSKEFLATGFAEKEGEIAIHFNTASGACKVMNVTVNLAELSIAVDKAGNITIENSVLDYYEGYDNLTWEPYEYENFVTWYIGVLPIQYFNGAITEDVMYDSVLGTYGWMFGVDEKPYVEGEYELQVVETSLQWMFENINYEEMNTTESYVVYLIPFADGGMTPVFEDAVYASFKQLNVVVEEVEAYYNDVLLNVTFAGAEKYHVTAVAESDLEWYDGVEGYIQENIMMYFAYDYIQFANTIEEDFYGKEISLRGLIDYGTEPWYSVLPNETYYLIVLPIEDSSVAYTDYVLEDFRYYSFESLDIEEAAEPIEHTATFVEEDSSALGISVQVSYDPEVVDYAYYKWYSEEQIGLTKEELLMGSEVNLDYPAYESCSAPGQQKVLAVLLVNKNGEYTIAQHTFQSKEVVYSDAVISFESVTFEDGYINVTIAGAENAEYFRYYVNAVDVANTSEEFLAPLAYKTISGGKTAYSNPFSQAYTSNWSQFAEGNTYFIALVAVFMDGSVTEPITGEFTYEAAVVETVDVVATSASARFDSNNSYATVVDFQLAEDVVASVAFRTGEGAWDPDYYFTRGLDYIVPGQWTTWAERGDSSVWYTNAYINGVYATINGTIEVAYDEVYSFAFSIDNYNVTYTGAVEGLVAPVIEEEGGEAEEISINRFQIIPYGMMEVEVHFYLDEGAQNKIVLDFRIEEADAKLKTRNYSWNENGFEQQYSYINGTSGEFINDASIDVVVNEDGTYSFEGYVKSTAKTYPISISGTPAAQ
ncbi:MAG: hypothetical protein J6V55_07170 [Alistipes sp.]|nr:hypothetical protein [Alistipes sp.]